MDIFKVSVAVEGRNLDILLKAGVLATIETGTQEQKVEKPKSKVSVIISEGKQGISAWVQVGQFDDKKIIHISHEGWVREGQGQINALSPDAPAAASLSRVESPTEEMRKCQEDADFGALACCIAYGNGCYVRCCNSCCADPVRCPGARCCG